MYNKNQKILLSAFTVGEIENPITCQSVADKMDTFAIQKDGEDKFQELVEAKKAFDVQFAKTEKSSNEVAEIIKGVCELCGGMGEYTLPAEQSGGEIVDEKTMTCRCGSVPCEMCREQPATQKALTPFMDEKKVCGDCADTMQTVKL